MAVPPKLDDHDTKHCRLGIVIINYRTPELVKQCLKSMMDQLEAADACVAIVDNASGDGSVEDLTAWLQALEGRQRLQLIASPENTGFSGGNNIGLNALQADFYLLLNSDTVLRPGALQNILEAMEAHPNAGVVAPRLEDMDSTAQVSAFRFHTPASELIAAAGTGIVTRALKAFEVPIGVSDEPMAADWVSFACVLIRKEAIAAAGLMDEGFFMYFEDADYCRTIKRAGYDVIYDPSARVVHLRGGSSSVKERMAQRKRPPAYYYASRTRYFRKNFGPIGLFLANVMWLAGRGIAHIRLLAGKAPPPICEAQGRDNWMNWRTPLRKWRIS